MNMANHAGNPSRSFEVPGIVNPAAQIFGGFRHDGSTTPPVLPGPIMQDHGDSGSADENDSKRRRIARVGEAEPPTFVFGKAGMLIVEIGMRYVSEKED